MKHLYWLSVVCLALALGACSTNNSGDEGGNWSCDITASVPDFGSAVFTNPTVINNQYFPLVPGTVNLFRVPTEDGLETIVVQVLSTTQTVNGVNCVVVRDTVYLDDLVVEDTYDWYAQDDTGNVWYFGEDVTNYEYDDNDMLIGTTTSGSWEAGADIASTGTNAIAGIIMPATPVAGETFYLEFYPGVAEDLFRIEGVNVPIILSDGRSFNCVQTLECNPLAEDSLEYKFYAPGIGMVREENIEDGEFGELRGTFTYGGAGIPNFGAATFTTPTTIDNPLFPLTPGYSYTFNSETEDGIELIIVDVLSNTQTVNGVLCVVVRDRVFLEGRLIEDTIDWYAQDDAGNVWYMGEFVTNYVYNETTGALLSTNNAGSWEAGVGGAVPGFQMLTAPSAGVSYHQEFWTAQAEDAAFVVRTDATVNLTNGPTYTNCLQTLDWNPLAPTHLEYKFYATGVGMVMEIEVDGEEIVELTSVTP